MALTLGTSSAASFRNMQYLSQTKSLMDKSLQRISSGKRILSAGDDPGGLAFSMRLQNELTINNAVQSAVENAKSFTEMQDSALKSAGDILLEMQSLQTKHRDSMTSNTDKAIYAGQFRDLQVQLGGLRSEKLSGVSLFSSSSTHKSASTIYTSAQGASGSSITLGNLDLARGLSISADAAKRTFLATSAGTVNVFGGVGTGVALSIKSTNGDHMISMATISNGIDQIASLRAQSGGKASSLGFASEYLATKSIGLQSAHSRIMDADFAEETLNYSKYSLQYQAGAAALAQSNLSMQVVLDLLKFPSIRS
ncbi:MAG: flagellin [Opitutae bacterium]|nr:flagellin [Opitutae bacterium]